MKQKWTQLKEFIQGHYTSMPKWQKGLLFGGAGAVIVAIVMTALLANSSNMVPLYNDLSVQEIGQIKEELDARGVPYEIGNAGTSVQVSEEAADSLLVDLAAKGIPDSGNIDYSFFAANSSWGMTDNEFDVMKLDAMQTELSTLISQINGISAAEVMINKPEDPVFVSDQQQEGSASIVIETDPGYQFEPGQIESLYHLVAKSVPNLSTDNIVIMNQHFEYFDQKNENSLTTNNTYSTQQQIKKDIEQDIERRVQKMLGMMVGMDRVAISATADVDFTQEQRRVEQVETVDDENDTLPVSVETITESYTGTQPEDLEVGVGEEEIANYPAGENGVGDYELVKESVNHEFNRIQRDIVESPYKIRDLGIQVAIDNTRTLENGEIEQLSAQEQLAVEESVTSILDSIVTTSIDKSYGEVVTPNQNVSIVFQPFNGTNNMMGIQQTPVIPTWVYVTGTLFLLIILSLIWLLIRKRRQVQDNALERVEEQTISTEEEVPPITMNEDSDAHTRRKQLERYAQDKPEDFAKLLRSWISED
ncbi:flagellar basal-body MS-ring/collar protein FliF [Gracilibacillus sp. YIM 98692]|uniref:flagellar basal-body MS-ring/collar protein FliF n=1 Tax=Gracilibacillus sp. YIM 98692 TaxID=2663532 RepID=UPI0013D89648|nr:flagellar basal-body MS-ring/collar protein FliF [Gracilibacillus sp. YIM 98692]